jgi:CRP/FNR family transcriptional regulator
MFAEAYSSSRSNEDRGKEHASVDAAVPGSILTLQAGQVLFRAGEPKRRIYRVIEGGFGLSDDANGHLATGYALTGSFLGLGFLDSHQETAQALSMTRVECLSLDAVRDMVASDPRIGIRLTEAAEREFAQLRSRAAGSGMRTPAQKVAAYLLAASQINAREGRDPHVIHEDLNCGILADWLGLEMDAFTAALVTLKSRRLLASAADGAVRLIDIAGLERVSESLAT